jgi:L-ascorbate metabolism protein UlaG (beta-lactamase superfamily)
MIITHYGGECFKIQTGDTVIAFNPPSKNSKLKALRFGADVTFVSLNDDDFNGVENNTYGEKEPLIISGPGEYEVKGIFIKGFPTETTYGKESKINTVYSVLFDGIKLCFLGALGSADAITSEIKGDISNHDILFVPIGGGDVLSPSEAGKAAVSLVPKVIIPMHYDGVGEEDALKTFLKEEGGEKISPIEKLTIKKKDLEGKEGEIIVVKST